MATSVALNPHEASPKMEQIDRPIISLTKRTKATSKGVVTALMPEDLERMTTTELMDALDKTQTDAFQHRTNLKWFESSADLTRAVSPGPGVESGIQIRRGSLSGVGRTIQNNRDQLVTKLNKILPSLDPADRVKAKVKVDTPFRLTGEP